MNDTATVVEIDDALRKPGRPAREVSEWGKPFLKNLRKSGNIMTERKSVTEDAEQATADQP